MGELRFVSVCFFGSVLCWLCYVAKMWLSGKGDGGAGILILAQAWGVWLGVWYGGVG